MLSEKYLHKYKKLIHDQMINNKNEQRLGNLVIYIKKIKGRSLPCIIIAILHVKNKSIKLMEENV